MKPSYLYRRGSIVTTTWGRGGEICKVLARPGQIAYDTVKKDIYVLQIDEYILYNELWIGGDIWLVAQENTKPIQGFLVNVFHIRPALSYEKILRRYGENVSPIVTYTKPAIEVGVIGVFTLISAGNIKPKMVSIVELLDNNQILLSNGEIISHNFFKQLYRNPVNYEQISYCKKHKLFPHENSRTVRQI